MGEFVELSVVKTAARKLVTPLADLAALNSIVEGVLENNLFECSAYQLGTTSHLPMEKTRESYTARIAYQDDDAKTIGSVSARTSTTAGYTSAITAINATRGSGDGSPVGQIPSRRLREPAGFSIF